MLAFGKLSSRLGSELLPRTASRSHVSLFARQFSDKSSSKIESSFAANPSTTATPGAPHSSTDPSVTPATSDTSSFSADRVSERDATSFNTVRGTTDQDGAIPDSSNQYAQINNTRFDKEDSTYDHEQEMKELKRRIGASPPFMGGWILLGAAAFLGSSYWYYTEADSYQRHVDPVIKKIRSADKEVRRAGLIELEKATYSETRLFSRFVDIPQPSSVLVERGVVSSLLLALTDEDRQIKQMAAMWLVSFADNLKARTQIAKGISDITSTMNNSAIGSPLWLTCSSLLMKLSRTKDSRGFLESKQFADTLGVLYHSNHPLATLVAGNVAKTLMSTPGGEEIVQESGIPLDDVPALTTSHCAAALNGAVRTVSTRGTPVNPIFSTDTLLHLNWAAAFAVFGSLYGRLRWIIHARYQGLQGPQLWKFVKKRSKTGRYVFLLLCMDLASQAIMSIPPEGVQVPYTDQVVKVPRHIGELPLNTAVPIAESALFTAVGLWAIRYQRYVVLPIALASTIAHWDTIQKYTKPYQEQLGIREYLNFQLPSYMTFSNRDSRKY